MLIIILSLLFFQSFASEMPVQSGESLHTIFQKIEKETGYKFLYRDALVADKTADFTMNDSWRESLSALLDNSGLAASIDDERQRVVIYEGTPSNASETEIGGYVIDSESGERLPFATVSWQADGKP